MVFRRKEAHQETKEEEKRKEVCVLWRKRERGGKDPA